MDYRSLVSRADLHYDKTVKRSEGGLPIGNGTMGSLIWTSPSAVKFQVNRVDVYAADCSTNSFNQRHSDYGYACGFVDIDVVDYGEDAFQDEDIAQHLSVFDALATIRGAGVKVQTFAVAHQDVFAVRVEDDRPFPQGINVKLKMLRPAEVVTKNHTAISELGIVNDMIVLKQQFREGRHYCSSAVVIGISGRDSVIRLNDELGGKAKVNHTRTSIGLGQPNETEMRLCLKPGPGRADIFIASAATFDEEEDIVAKAVQQLEQARNAGYERLLEEHKAWWNAYWSKSYIALQSADGSAEFVEMHYTYYLYLMASNSRGGKFPMNFGGMLLSPRGDARHWGAMQWWNNLNLYYNAILPSGHYELLQPYFSMFSGMYDSCAKAAEQQWGSKGIYIPEVVWFNGLEELPDDIAAEMRDLYLLRKPWEQMSERFRDFAYSKHPHESRWNWKYYEKFVDGKLVYSDKGYGPFGFTTHMFANQVGVAYHFWMYYEYTLDETWLRERAYPMIKGAAEFFRHFPNLRKEADGKYHIVHTMSDEKYADGKDTMDSMSAMHGILPVVLRASELLGVDEELRPAWKELYENLAPIPTSDHPDAVLRTDEGEPAVWVGAIGPVLDNRSHIDLRPARFCSLCTQETAHDNPGMYQTALATIKYQEARLAGDWSRAASEMSPMARVLANMGLAEPFKQVVLAQLNCVNAEREYCYFNDTGRIKFFENRLTVREGVNCLSAQRLGNAAAGLQLALCQSEPPGPGKDPIIRLFPACPGDWDAEFSLWCHGGFIVTSARRQGAIPFVKISSTLGGTCRLRNPWGEQPVRITGAAEKSILSSGSLLLFETSPGRDIMVEPS
ncbi:hypothetical protein PAECIP111802_00371 [Paenibacillus allorhizosphaerae]|uniref:Glycosyl hydrolase family 95 catalytic domain-containing protein n=2 Tax=Paenibacillus allorhizosphaerae TaxID=2849866 RepID=A0ABM8VAR3_9BACL|nr:hypothetical protein PAECIP111802_00371 [Paenibacillus allorhizosphaerae]